jgi:hypothetical protein
MPLISVLRDIIQYQIFYDISAYVMVPARRAGAGWGRQAPGPPQAPATPSPIWLNMLGTRVQLNGDGLDAVHGLVALAAVRVMHCGRVVVIKKSRLAAAAAAGFAAHAGKAPRMTLRLQVWTRSPRWIQVGNWRGG